jgi:DNA-directed RNA polymerase specialized sigma24 family protein
VGGVDDTSYDEFFRREYPALVGFLRKLGFKQEQAEDAAGQAMLNAYLDWPKITSPGAWVRTVARRIAYNTVGRTDKEVKRANQK